MGWTGLIEYTYAYRQRMAWSDGDSSSEHVWERTVQYRAVITREERRLSASAVDGDTQTGTSRADCRYCPPHEGIVSSVETRRATGSAAIRLPNDDCFSLYRFEAENDRYRYHVGDMTSVDVAMLPRWSTQTVFCGGKVAETQGEDAAWTGSYAPASPPDGIIGSASRVDCDETWHCDEFTTERLRVDLTHHDDELSVRIHSAKPDKVAKSLGKSDRYSIPRAGDRNLAMRSYELAYSCKPANATLHKVRVELTGADHEVLDEILDDGPGVSVTELGAGRVRVTVSHRRPSGVATDPPPCERIFYRFAVSVRDDDGRVTVSEPFESEPRWALWKMPHRPPLDRFGHRDAGGDDWCSKSTYLWLARNRGLLLAINDISGEHARNLGHQSHLRGADIDFFHAATIAGVGDASGGAVTRQLAALLVRAATSPRPQVRTNAQTALSEWVLKTRTWADRVLALTGDDEVLKIFFGTGCPIYDRASLAKKEQNQWNAPKNEDTTKAPCFEATTPGARVLFAAGWMKSLIARGRVRCTNGVTVVLGLPSWTNGDRRVSYTSPHNDHIHVSLRPPQETN